MVGRQSLPLVLLSASSAHAWCCRSCGKCMCELYGVCPAPSTSAPPPPAPSLATLSVADVAAFIASLAPDGSRQFCPPGCSVPDKLNASLFLERHIDGAMLLRLYEAHNEPSWVHNATLRAAHSEYLASQRLFGGAGVAIKHEHHIALMTRVRDGVRQAGYVPAPPVREREPKRLLQDGAQARPSRPPRRQNPTKRRAQQRRHLRETR